MIRIKCPVCKTNKDNHGFNLVNLQLHITKKAQYEVWQKALDNTKKTPHFTYYKEHYYHGKDK